MLTNQTPKSINKVLSTLTFDQILTLSLYCDMLNPDHNLFMSESSHKKFCSETPLLPFYNDSLSSKTLLTNAISKYISKSKYSLLLSVIEMIKKDSSPDDILDLLENN